MKLTVDQAQTAEGNFVCGAEEDAYFGHPNVVNKYNYNKYNNLSNELKFPHASTPHPCTTIAPSMIWKL